VISSSINDKVRIRSESNRFFLLFDNAASRRLKRGTLLHRIFELINDDSEINKTIDSIISEGLLLEEEAMEVKNSVRSFFEMKEFREWFDGSWEVLNEREILAQGNFFRPDKVLIKPDQTLVIDYKSGDKEAKHQKQIKGYARLLAEMGYPNILKYLVYLDQGEIELVD
jgi:ATP-dependent exoDNAse (exonuclease V) beta subunit